MGSAPGSGALFIDLVVCWSFCLPVTVSVSSFSFVSARLLWRQVCEQQAAAHGRATLCKLGTGGEAEATSEA